MKRKKYYCLYPSGLNLDKILEKYPPNFIFNKDYFYWLISEVCTKSTYKMKEDDRDCWVGLCSSIMKNHPYRYNDHLKYLIDEKTNGGVLWGKKYTEGKCFSYRLADKYFMDTLNVYEIKDSNLLKYINRTQNLRVESNNMFKKKYNFLAKYFESGELKIDINGALKENLNLFKSSPKPYEALLKQRLNAIHITRISNENYNLTFSYKTDGRIHSQITNLSKNLRKYVTYGGEKLAEVDIKSSVPTFFYFIIKELSKRTKNPDLNKILSNISDYHHMCEENLKSIDITSIESFGCQILKGTFYESFYDDYNIIEDELKLRNSVKNDMLSMMFAKNTQYKKVQEIFGKQHPDILNWIHQFKRDNHKLFSYLTMQTEAHYILNKVARTVNQRYRGKMPLFTLHDCLITTIDNVDQLYVLTQDILINEMGLSPILTKKIWE